MPVPECENDTGSRFTYCPVRDSHRTRCSSLEHSAAYALAGVTGAESSKKRCRMSTSVEVIRRRRMSPAPSARLVPRPWIRDTRPMPGMPGRFSSAAATCATRALTARRTFIGVVTPKARPLRPGEDAAVETGHGDPFALCCVKHGKRGDIPRVPTKSENQTKPRHGRPSASPPGLIKLWSSKRAGFSKRPIWRSFRACPVSSM